MNGTWIDGMPKWFRIGVVIFGLLSLGAAGGKTMADWTGHAAILAEDHLILQELQKQTCMQLAQLSKTDWAHCVAPVNAAH